MRRAESPAPPRGARPCTFCGRAPSDCPHLGTACSAVWSGDDSIIPVVAAVARSSDRVLICQRRADKRHGLLWEFPGGKLVQDETLAEALRRELAEELDLEVSTLGRYLGNYRDPGAPFLIHFVEARVTGEPVAREHERVAWVPEGELASYPLAPGDRAFVNEWLVRSGRG